MKKRGFTLIELLVVIAIIAMLLAVLMPALSKVKKIAQRVVCGTNLKGLGTAQTVYANDYDDEYAVQGAGGAHTWARRTAGWLDTAKNWQTAGDITVGASLYLLVREADVSPKSFVCPSSDQKPFDGKNSNNLDIIQLWDFGSYTVENNGPENCVSYSYHQPYVAVNPGTGQGTGSKSRYAASGTRSAAFALMADQNPYFENPKLKRVQATSAEDAKEKVWKLGNGSATEADVATGLQNWQYKVNNALPHDREGQNVLYADGHSSNETRTDVGIKNDCIYTVWTAVDNLQVSRRCGSSLVDTGVTTVAKGMDDSILVNDGELAIP